MNRNLTYAVGATVSLPVLVWLMHQWQLYLNRTWDCAECTVHPLLPGLVSMAWLFAVIILWADVLSNHPNVGKPEVD